MLRQHPIYKEYRLWTPVDADGLHQDRLQEPLRARKPSVIMVDGEPHTWTPARIDMIMAVIAACPQHTFLWPIKAVRVVAEYFSGDSHNRVRLILASQYGDYRTLNVMQWPLPYLHIGAIIHTQTDADRDIPALLQIPGNRFVWLQPREEVDVVEYLHKVEYHGDDYVDVIPPLSAVLLSGETGPDAPPVHPDWARKTRDDCQAAGVPFGFLGWGKYRPALPGDEAGGTTCFLKDGPMMERVGARRSGRQLDGREYDVEWRKGI